MSLMRMNAGELTKRLQEHPGLIKHMIRDDHVILVDETEALVKFVQAQAQVNELWKEQGEFIRCAPLYDAGDLIQPEGLAGCWFDPNESASGRIDIRAEGNHYSIEFTFESDEHLTFAAQVIKMRDLLLMGVFFGPEDMRSREMATRMPDWYAMIVLKKDRFDLTMLDFIEVKELLAHPEKAQDIQGEADARLIRVKP
jgi:hypothetical protein